RRAGDVAQCYADASLAQSLLGWRAAHTLADMCADAWRWQQGNPNGYAQNNE
ncbi:MAG: UDP-glucose 4-epimerase GalE, partial [Rhodoferax sp.]|nr:UDP-glucose 4-epimerase GalE [Rhodoferax sp.]